MLTVITHHDNNTLLCLPAALVRRIVLPWASTPVAAVLSYPNLQLWCLQLVRDAEMLAPSEVALLPIVLMQLYQQRTRREQTAVATHPFFEGLIKPWALEPSKLTVQVCHACMLPLGSFCNTKCLPSACFFKSATGPDLDPVCS